jgi:hypothetical protein
MLDRLEDYFADEPVLVAGAVPEAEVDRIGQFVGFPLPTAYRDFVRSFGAGIVGPYPIFGSGTAEAMASDDGSVIDVTKRFRTDGWSIARDSLVISRDHAGNPFVLNEDGAVRRFDHDVGTDEEVTASFDKFVNWCLSRS